MQILVIKMAREDWSEDEALVVDDSPDALDDDGVSVRVSVSVSVRVGVRVGVRNDDGVSYPEPSKSLPTLSHTDTQTTPNPNPNPNPNTNPSTLNSNAANS